MDNDYHHHLRARFRRGNKGYEHWICTEILCWCRSPFISLTICRYDGTNYGCGCSLKQRLNFYDKQVNRSDWAVRRFLTAWISQNAIHLNRQLLSLIFHLSLATMWHFKLKILIKEMKILKPKYSHAGVLPILWRPYLASPTLLSITVQFQCSAAS